MGVSVVRGLCHLSRIAHETRHSSESSGGFVRKGVRTLELRKDNRPILDFAKLKSVMPMPNLLDIQLRSFEKLVEPDLQDQWDFGLDRVFGEIFPIEDVNEHFLLEYVSSAFG